MHKSWMWKQRSYREQFEDGSSAGGSGDAHASDDQEQGGADGSDAQGDAGQGDDTQATGQGDQEPGQQADGAAGEEVVIGFGDDPAAENEEAALELTPAQNSAWARMRKAEQEAKKRARELEAELASHRAAAAPKEEDVGAEPDLSDDDVDFDPTKFKAKWTTWNERKVKAEEKAKAARQAQEAEATAWQGKVTAYRAAGAALNAGDFGEAESVVLTALSPTQQSILVEGPKTPQASAQLVAALARNPAKLTELAAIKNPVRYAFAVAELVSQLKVQPKKAPPAPERQVRGTAGAGTAVDNTLARLEAEADRTGDRSKVIAYKRDQRSKQAA